MFTKSTVWRQKNIEHVRAYEQMYRKQNREKLRLKAQKWRDDHPNYKWSKSEEAKTRKRQYNKEYQKIYLANYRKKNREKLKVKYRQYAATRRKLTVGNADYSVILSKFDGICKLCGQRLDTQNEPYHFDHIIPLSKGGLHANDNLQVTHPMCNFKKSNKLVDIP